MERSEWSDDEASSPVPPPHLRAWRHPSELGRTHGALPTPGCGRSRSNRLALAVAAGTAGTLAIATIAVTTFAGAHRHSSPTTSAINDAPTTDVASARTIASTEDIFTTLASVTSPGSRVTAAQRSAGATSSKSAPAPAAVITLSRSGGGGGNVAAVVTDAGTVWAVAEDVAGVDHLEVASTGGETVTVMVGQTDPDTGLVQLHPTKPINTKPSAPVAWLGVNCSDEYIEPSTTTAPAAGEGATDGALAVGNAPSTTATSLATAPSTTSGSKTDPATGESVAALAPTSNPAGRTTIASIAVTTTAIADAPVAVAPSPRTTAANDATARTVDDASKPAGTSIRTTTVVEPSAPTTTSAASDDGSALASSATTTTTYSSTDAAASNGGPTPPSWPAHEPALGGSHTRGVHVHAVVSASPAAAGGLQPGDVIIAADGRPVRTVWALVLAVRRHAAGEQLTLLVRRDGALITLAATLSSQPAGQT